MEEKIEKMKQLSKIINEASIAYYVNDDPIMSDKQWDKLYNELLALEAETGVVLENSPSQKVGGDALDKFVKVLVRSIQELKLERVNRVFTRI